MPVQISRSLDDLFERKESRKQNARTQTHTHRLRNVTMKTFRNEQEQMFFSVVLLNKNRSSCWPRIHRGLPDCHGRLWAEKAESTTPAGSSYAELGSDAERIFVV